jgi:hypothetical protein
MKDLFIKIQVNISIYGLTDIVDRTGKINTANKNCSPLGTIF